MAEKEKTKKEIARRDPLEDWDWFERWSPFRELAPLRFGRLFDDFLEERWGRRGRLVPAVDIAEDSDKYAITVELPGTKKDDLTVEMHENVLTIRGEKKSEREEKREQSRLVERSYGSFSRSFTLPANAAAERIRASFSEGVLTIELPKTEEAKPKVISIKS